MKSLKLHFFQFDSYNHLREGKKKKEIITRQCSLAPNTYQNVMSYFDVTKIMIWNVLLSTNHLSHLNSCFAPPGPGCDIGIKHWLD